MKMNPDQKILSDLFDLINEREYSGDGTIPNSHKGIMFGASLYNHSIIHSCKIVGKICDIGTSPPEKRQQNFLELAEMCSKAVYSSDRSRKQVRSVYETGLPGYVTGVGLRIGKRYFKQGFPYRSMVLTCCNFRETLHNDVFLLALTRTYYPDFRIEKYLERCVIQRRFSSDDAHWILTEVKALLSED